MQNQQVMGEPDHYLRKQEGLRIFLEKTYVGYVIEESQNFRYPDLLFVVVVGGTAGWISFAAACFVICCILAYVATMPQQH